MIKGQENVSRKSLLADHTHINNRILIEHISIKLKVDVCLISGTILTCFSISQISGI